MGAVTPHPARRGEPPSPLGEGKAFGGLPSVAVGTEGGGPTLGGWGEGGRVPDASEFLKLN